VKPGRHMPQQRTDNRVLTRADRLAPGERISRRKVCGPLFLPDTTCPLGAAWGMNPMLREGPQEWKLKRVPVHCRCYPS
jgi:hypothetical protein